MAKIIIKYCILFTLTITFIVGWRECSSITISGWKNLATSRLMLVEVTSVCPKYECATKIKRFKDYCDDFWGCGECNDKTGYCDYKDTDPDLINIQVQCDQKKCSSMKAPDLYCNVFNCDKCSTDTTDDAYCTSKKPNPDPVLDLDLELDTQLDPVLDMELDLVPHTELDTEVNIDMELDPVLDPDSCMIPCSGPPAADECDKYPSCGKCDEEWGFCTYKPNPIPKLDLDLDTEREHEPDSCMISCSGPPAADECDKYPGCGKCDEDWGFCSGGIAQFGL